jgi:hypothetical protein
MDHSRFRRLTDAHRRSVVAGVTSFLVASAFVLALASPAHAAGSRPTSPKPRSASPTARASLSTHDAIAGYGHWVVEKIKGGDVPERYDFMPISLAELGRMYHTEVGKGVFTLIASRVENGEVKQAEFLAPRLEGSQIVYGNSYDEKLTEDDLKSRGYRNFFVRTFDRPAPTGETGAPEASPATTPEALTRTLTGRAKEIYDYLNNVNSPGSTNLMGATLNGKTVVYSPTMAKIFKYVVENPETTALEIHRNLDIPAGSARMGLMALRNKGLVVYTVNSNGAYQYSVAETLPALEYPSRPAGSNQQENNV